MEETKLLIFRSGIGQYGIPIEEVSGIIASTGVNGLSSISDMDLGFKAGEKKSAIISHVNGVQIVIIVDEIIEEKRLISDESEEKLDATITSLQIWNLK